MSIRTQMIERIDTFQARLGLSDRALSLRAGRDPKLVQRLRRGENVTLKSLEQLESLLVIGDDAA